MFAEFKARNNTGAVQTELVPDLLTTLEDKSHTYFRAETDRDLSMDPGYVHRCIVSNLHHRPTLGGSDVWLETTARI